MQISAFYFPTFEKAESTIFALLVDWSVSPLIFLLQILSSFSFSVFLFLQKRIFSLSKYFLRITTSMMRFSLFTWSSFCSIFNMGLLRHALWASCVRINTGCVKLLQHYYAQHTHIPKITSGCVWHLGRGSSLQLLSNCPQKFLSYRITILDTACAIHASLQILISSTKRKTKTKSRY